MLFVHLEDHLNIPNASLSQPSYFSILRTEIDQSAFCLDFAAWDLVDGEEVSSFFDT